MAEADDLEQRTQKSLETCLEVRNTTELRVYSSRRAEDDISWRKVP